jgi:23S rRNA (uridine2552-2'-O)-methyltransferase
MTGRDTGSGRGHSRVRVKTTRGRKVSSQRWLERQLNDPYVSAAKSKGYRSRAAFKLLELDAKFHLLHKGARVLDLGAAPGGWTQVAVARVGDTGRVVAVDILPMDPVPGADVLEADLLAAGTPARLESALGGPADLVLSDMAAPTTGHRATDHIRTTALFEAALDMAELVLKPGGAFHRQGLPGGSDGRFAHAREEKLSRRETREAAGEPGGVGRVVSGGDGISEGIGVGLSSPKNREAIFRPSRAGG